MADYTAIKNLITDVVKTNGEQEITGANLQNVLVSMINAVASSNNEDFDRINGSILNLLNHVDTENEDIRNEMQELANRLDTNRYGYNVTVFGLVAGVHTLATAVKNVPPAERFGGQKITFKTDAGWVTYQNISLSIDNYEDVNNWVLDSGVNVEGDVTISNNPDYEDLTQNAQNELKFADKEYNAATFSGLGRVYLRKNIISNKNVLTQAMLSDANTIYIIQYDYDLNGASVTIPANCALKFEGGSINNGNLALNGVEIIANSYNCFKSVVLNGSFANQVMDVRCVGIFPNDATFDTGLYIKTYLLGVDNIEWFFPAGNYYLSELHITRDKFSISGVARKGNALTCETKFFPFNTSQYYILKLGGKATALSPTNTVNSSKIYDIQFSCPDSYVPKSMTNEYSNATSTYTSALCVLDMLNVGLFAISGSSCYANVPSLLFGQIYECIFDYLIFYGAQCKSDCPRLQIVCNQSYSISATHILLFMAENVAGKLIATSEAAALNGLVIDQLTFEGVVQWITGISDIVKYGNEYRDYTLYTQVPLLDLRGYANITINKINLTECNQEWINSADNSSQKSIRTLANLKANSEDVRIGSIINDGNSSSLFVNVVNVTPVVYTSAFAIDNLYKCSIYVSSNALGWAFYYNNIQLFDANGQDRGLPHLAAGTLYTGVNLLELSEPQSVANVGTLQYGFKYDLSKAFQYGLRIKNRTDAAIINKNGFIIDTNYVYIIASRATTNMVFIISYRDSSNNVINEETITTTSPSNTVTYCFLKLNKPSNCHHIVFFNGSSSYLLEVYGIMATNNAVYAPTSGGTRPAGATVNTGFLFYDTTISKSIVYNGTSWVNVDGSALS